MEVADLDTAQGNGTSLWRRVHLLAWLGMLVSVLTLVGPAWAQTAGRTAGAMEPPPGDDATEVRLRFLLQDVQHIDDAAQAFSWAGVLTASWFDSRRAFEPEEGQSERLYQGAYQVEELAAGWIPRFVLVDALGVMQSESVWLRVKADGACTMQRTLHGTTRVLMDMRWFPFDQHELPIQLALGGPDQERVELVLDEGAQSKLLPRGFRVPEWSMERAEMSMESLPSTGRSTLLAVIEVKRQSAFMRRLVTFPLSVIVLLSFSVFWMSQDSMADRVNVSFIGILTTVSYQLIMGESMPHVAAFTLMQGFLMLSFLVMAGTVVINVVVGRLRQRGNEALALRIDQRCRWVFPLVWFALVAVLFLWTLML